MKAILIGNGFTSNMISSYKNEPMMDRFYESNQQVVDKLESLFHSFRDVELSNEEIYCVTEALYPSESLYPSEGLYPSDNDILPQPTVKNRVVSILNDLGFSDSNAIFDEYFHKYGLMYSLNTERIIGIETYLKVIHLFIKAGLLDEKKYMKT